MKKIESGRSMIEMLGVLAVIGVLSIGGLAGYTMAMNRHRANTIVDYVSRVAVLAQTRGQGDETFSATTTCSSIDGNIPSTVTSCTVSKPNKTDDLTINVTGLTSAVAKAISNRGGTTGVSVNASGTAATFTYYNT